MRITKLSTLATTGLMALSLLGACGGTSNNGSEATSGDGEATTEAPALSGQLNLSGASALQPLAKAGAEQFMAANPDVVVDVQGGGSGTGLQQVSEGAVDIGNSDVFAEEKLDAAAAGELVDHQVAVVVMAPVVAADLAVDSLTTQQLIDVFTGKVKNWSEVGGPDLDIQLATRPESSGTRATFKAYALNGTDEASGQALENDDSGTLVQSIKQTPGAIGYVALSYVDDEIKTVKIDDVEPSLENVYNGSYKVWAYEHMYTKGEPTELAQAYLDFMLSEEFAPTVEEMGYGVTAQLTDEAKATHE